METLTTDVLIIGSGAAGLSAAVYAAQSNKDVLILDKGVIGRSGSSTGAVQIAGLGEWSDPGDHKQSYLNDINVSGRGLSDPQLTTRLAEDIEPRLKQLIDWGLKLDKDEHKQVAISHTSGHSVPRSLSAKKGKTGLGITHTLRKKATNSPHIQTWSDVITVDLIKASERVIGAVVFDLTTNKTYFIQSKAVVLTTGGIGQLFPITSNPVQATSDGFSLGLSVGARLIDMEQIQFYPVSIIAPQAIAGFCISFYHYAKLFNNKEQRFMEIYQPDTLEDSTRDKLSIAIASEIAKGNGTPNQAVWIDARDAIEQVKREFPHEYKVCNDRGVNLAIDRAEIGPAAHFMMGGIQINQEAATSVPGLYVAGETAGGLHGGNRLGNNALSECIVFGAIAGMNAVKEAERATILSVDPSLWKASSEYISHLFSATNGRVRPFQLKDEIQAIMGQHASVIRTTEGLETAEKQLKRVEHNLASIKITNTNVYSRELLDAIEVRHMLRTAKAIIKASLQRQESRGAHYIEDFPQQSETIQHTFINNKGGKLIARSQPVKGGPT
ncbi:L-aspartate oxidase [Aquibacillus sediminis]|uniref:L-aspartate oxidase n=1 Tax=Aquibacillus sediminis TaxID=2574734 RepID=UPI001109ACFD|nr:FAD-dependent oxidoreductase [Aquibacillus sediminis]